MLDNIPALMLEEKMLDKINIVVDDSPMTINTYLKYVITQVLEELMSEGGK